MSETPYDLLIVGGGINGAGIARDAAGRGLKVALVEQGDLAQATSSASSKLIHGGLRYLEHYEFRLVREALAEREVLLGIAPHIAWPLTFVLPHAPEMRPAWMIRTGLFLYDHLARRNRLPGSSAIDLTRHPAGAAIKPEYTRGFTYSDGWVDDSRLVVLNAVDARERGASIHTHCRFVSARREGGAWQAQLSPAQGEPFTVSARILVNAAGPWVDDVARGVTGRNARGRVRLVKGSHIVVPRIPGGDDAYILQQPDRRVVFLLPFAGRFTLIGTTDVPHESSAGPVAISPEETDYLCGAANRFLRKPITPGDVVWSYAGLRPLQEDDSDDPSAITRDYLLELDDGGDGPPMLSVIGGKITTYRRLAEHALEKLAPFIAQERGAWTASAPLPGGDIPGGDFAAYLGELQGRHAWLPAPIAHRLARAYGTRVEAILGNAGSFADLGDDLGHGLTPAEINYLRDHELARSAEDVLWRRSKLGLAAPPGLAGMVESVLAGQTSVL